MTHDGGVRHSGTTRREILKASLAAPALAVLGGLPACATGREGKRPEQPDVVVIGAGAFGGWTALNLARQGQRVVLVDAWGPGNSRSSSGGDTRVIRHGYGDNRIYQDMAARSLVIWKAFTRRWNRSLFQSTGVIWMVQDDDAFEQATLPHLVEAGIEHEVLDADELGRRYPQINTEGIRWALYEPDAGALSAREACNNVLEAFLIAGGRYRRASVQPGPVASDRMTEVRLSDGTTLAAGAFVFACGPWLGSLFPDVRPSPLVRPTRQEVYTFGPPAGDSAYSPPQLPVWADHGERFWYGIPGNQRRGFKVADDTRGPDFDPTNGDRTPTPELIERAREYIGFRFPGMRDAPLVDAQVCQYEQSPDGDFILDRHPRASNVWLLGGGSGHGFKHGPAIGELAAANVTGAKPVEPRFALSRFAETAG